MKRDTEMNNLIGITLGVLLVLSLGGCATSRNQQPASVERQDRLTVSSEIDSGTQPSERVELTEESGLKDYLVYAALYNPGLEAAFERWKGVFAITRW